MNKIIITGNCGHDCNPKQVNDKYVYNLSLAVSTGFGENKTTTWYDVNIWRNDDKLGTIAKGTKLLIEGEPTINVYSDKQGNPAGKIAVRCTYFEFLSSKAESEPTIEEVNKQQRVISSAASAKREATEHEDGELPF